MKEILVIFLAFAVTYGQSPAPAPPFGDECDYVKLRECLTPYEEATRDLTNRLQAMFMGLLVNGGHASQEDVSCMFRELRELCKLGSANLECLEGSGCDASIQIQSHDYLCGEGLTVIEQNYACLLEPGFTEEIVSCAGPLMTQQMLMGSRTVNLEDTCKLIFDFVDCMESSLSKHCPTVEHVVKHLMNILEPAFHYAGCELPRDAEPPMIIDEGGLIPNEEDLDDVDLDEDFPLGEDFPLDDFPLDEDFHLDEDFPFDEDFRKDQEKSGEGHHERHESSSSSESWERRHQDGDYRGSWDANKDLSTGGWVALCVGVLIFLLAAVSSILCYRSNRKWYRARAAAAVEQDPGLVNPVYMVTAGDKEKPTLDGPVVYAVMPEDDQKA